MKINLKKLVGTIAKVAGPAIITAVVLKQPVKKVIGQIVRDELDKAGA